NTRRAVGHIADALGIKPENVMLGNGSDENLSVCFQAFCDAARPACFADITYGFYPVFADICGVPTKIHPLNENFCIRPADYFSAPGTVFIANPNAPTGLALSREDIRAILVANPNNVVVVDEAYVDFGAESAVALVPDFENLIVVQTLSKSRSLAGARIGFAIAQAPLIQDLNTMRFSFNPYNLNRLSLLAAEAAILDTEYFSQCTAKICETRAYTAKALTDRGFTVLPSRANFIFTRPNRMRGGDYYRRLREKGVLVRHFDKPRISDYVRISIGSMDQMHVLLAATDELWEETR
ncbi:MAG: histidinol-phosphate transaminase, partial [Clostridia bacterium]|nr:histidinol-phosphate transaminase [Clostridia bacterium]